MTSRPKLMAVFDTNAYLGLGTAALEAFSEREAQAGVLSLGCTWSCLELLSRCAGPEEAKARRAHAALAKIARHVGYTGAAGHRIRIHEAGEFTLARGLFGHTPDEPLLEIGFVADLVVAAASCSLEALRDEHSDALSAASERVRLEEETFAAFAAAGIGSSPKQYLSAVPSSLDLSIVAAGLVQVLAERYDVPLVFENSGRAVNLVVENFPVALAFVYGLIRDSAGSGLLPGGTNSAWDLKVAFHAARGASVSGIPVLVVTNDKRILRAAQDADDQLRVVQLADYDALLGEPAHVAERSRSLARLSPQQAVPEA